MLAQLLQAAGYASMLLLPLYLDYLGADRSTIGAVMAVSAVGGLTARPVIAWGLDHWGRKPTLFIGTLVVVACFLAVAAVTEVGPLIYGIRIVMGMGLAALFTGYFTLASDLVPSSRRAEGLALFGIAGLLPLMVNPLAGRLGFAPAELRWFFPWVGLLIALSLLFLWPVEAPRMTGHRAPPTISEAWHALRARALWPVWCATAVFASLVAILMSFTTVVAEARGLEDPAVAWFTYAGGAVAVRAFGAQLPERVGLSRMLIPAMLSTITATALCGWVEGTVGFLMVGLLGGFGHGYCFPVLTAMTVNRSPEQLRGTALSVFTALWDVAKLLVVPAMGLLADLWSDGAMLAVSAAAGLVGLAMWASLEWNMPGSRP